MLELQDLKQTRVYQEGKQEGEADLVLRQLQSRFGEIPQNIKESIRELSVERLEDLGVALLDFEETEDLIRWLEQ